MFPPINIYNVSHTLVVSDAFLHFWEMIFSLQVRYWAMVISWVFYLWRDKVTI